VNAGIVIRVGAVVYVLAILIWLISGVIIDARFVDTVFVEGDFRVNDSSEILAKVNAISWRFALAAFGLVLVAKASRSR
jgi:hypothetical protein